MKASERRRQREAQARHFVEQVEQANQRLEQRAGRNLPVAILVALLFGGIVLIAALVDLWLLTAVAAIGAFFATAEIGQGLHHRDLHIMSWFAGALSLGIPFAAYKWESPGLWAGLGIAFLIYSAVTLAVRALPTGRTGHPYPSWVAGLGAILYVAGGIGSIGVIIAHEHGVTWLLGGLIVVVSNDTGAYAAGVLFGRHAMAPRISPKKTWEGQAGALISVVIAGTLVASLLLGLPWWVGLIIGVVLMFTATAGDLAESSFKRWLGVKDMSNWIPGHGGFMDRLDAVIPSMPAVLVLMLLLGSLAI